MTTSQPSSYPTQYQAYLVRFWRDHETLAWRVMVQDVHSKERYQFANFALLLAFLEHRTDDTCGLDESELPWDGDRLE